jgi:hypothetical protein
MEEVHGTGCGQPFNLVLSKQAKCVSALDCFCAYVIQARSGAEIKSGATS